MKICGPNLIWTFSGHIHNRRHSRLHSSGRHACMASILLSCQAAATMMRGSSLVNSIDELNAHGRAIFMRMRHWRMAET